MKSESPKAKRSILEDTAYEVPGEYFRLITENGEEVRIEAVIKELAVNDSQSSECCTDSTRPKKKQRSSKKV